MKKTLIAILACLTLSASAQFYNLRTNLFLTNTVAASATLTMAGTNYLDATRLNTIGIVAIWNGSNTNTNSVTWTFRASPDGTNWEVLPRFSLTGTSYGTNRSVAETNVSVATVGYLQAFQVVNANTNSLTNVTVYGLVKDFPRTR